MFHQKLKNCEEGMEIVYQMEKKLYNDGVISLGNTIKSSIKDKKVYTNKSLIQLEMTQLDMAAYPDLCRGIIYMFHVPLQGKNIVR